jgi:UDP-glucuronate 4-epimerase
MANILVTGGAGFIGSHVVDKLLAANHTITVLDNFNSFYDPAIKRRNILHHLDHTSYRLVEGDIRDAAIVNAAFGQGRFTEVIHLAAMAGVRPSIQDPVLYQEVNLIGTMNILEACRAHDVRQLIFASSSSVYGNNPKVPFSESDAVDHPISPYASTKKSGELMVYTYHHLYGIKSACLRFFTVYGPRQRPEMAIHLFTDRIARGEEIRVFGTGRSRRDYTYIDDIVAGILACREADYRYEVFNLGRSDTIELEDLVRVIEQALGKTARVVRSEQQAGDVDQTFADISKARRMLGFDPKTSIEDGIRKFVEWYRSRP